MHGHGLSCFISARCSIYRTYGLRRLLNTHLLHIVRLGVEVSSLSGYLYFSIIHRNRRINSFQICRIFVFQHLLVRVIFVFACSFFLAQHIFFLFKSSFDYRYNFNTLIFIGEKLNGLGIRSAFKDSKKL